MYSCEYCKIFRNNYFQEHLQTAVCVCVCVCVCVVCVCVCVYVCVCVCLYSSTVKASSNCERSGTYLRGTDQRCYVEYHFKCFCQVPSSPFLKMSYISAPKTPKYENPSEHKLERKRYDIWFRENTIYIDIGYKSAAHQTDKILKMRRLL